MRDLYETCNVGGIPQEEFEAGACTPCRNPSCMRAKGQVTKFARRMATQKARLLDNPNFSDAGKFGIAWDFEEAVPKVGGVLVDWGEPKPEPKPEPNPETLSIS